jgi:hypothetical protein
MLSQSSRRGFLKGSALLLGLASLFGQTIAWAKDVIYEKSELATEKKNPSVTALKYVADASTSKDRTVDKMGVAAKDQTCVNCNFYKEPGVLKGSKDAVGKCLMFQNQIVHGKGWCNVWTKKV